MKQFSREMIDALLLLAKKNNKEFTWWCDAYDDYAYQYSVCNICGEDLLSRDMMDHGINHLKEHNLLPFI